MVTRNVTTIMILNCIIINLQYNSFCNASIYKTFIIYSFFPLGLESEISYIRDGKSNTNAINYDLPVPFDVNKIVFTWQNFLGPFHLRQSEARLVYLFKVHNFV